MNTITQDEFKFICNNGESIGKKSGYPAVVIHPDKTITKIWVRKKLFSSATIYPYSSRFVRNARELHRRKVEVPEIINHARVENSNVRIVRYRALEGFSIRDLLRENPRKVSVHAIAKYFYELHEKGIFFRSIHLGNIVQLQGGDSYGLIDFTDVKFHPGPLSLRRRAINLATPLRYNDDVKLLKEAEQVGLVESYSTIANLCDSHSKCFKERVKSRD
jgi:hypothetical protein